MNLYIFFYFYLLIFSGPRQPGISHVIQYSQAFFIMVQDPLQKAAMEELVSILGKMVNGYMQQCSLKREYVQNAAHWGAGKFSALKKGN